MQKSVKRWSTGKVLVGTFILSALPLLIVELFPSRLMFVMDAAPYLVFHNIAEFFSIMVSLSMFGVGWFTYDQSKDRHALFLGTAFLGIGLIDFMHTMGMPAMPDFITANLPNKSIQFWVAVRLLQGIAFLASAYVYAERPSRWLTKKVLITSALLVSLLVFTGITFFPTYMPTTFIVGVGLTPFKKISEYLVIGLLCAATVAYWRRMERTGDRLLIYYLVAFVICIFSELVFAFYTRMFDTYNVLGHIYKVAAFSLIYYGIYKASVKAPYIRLTEVGEELKGEIAERKRTEKALKAEHQRIYDVLEALPAMICLLTPDYHVAFANRSFREKFGESGGRYCYEYCFGRTGPCDFCESYKVLETGKPHHWEVAAPDGSVIDAYDYPFTDMDGSTLILEMDIDITERKRTEEALRAAQRYNRSLIEASLDPLVTISRDGEITDVNRATELATGLSRDALIGSDFSDYFAKPEKAKEGYKQVFSEGSVRDYPLALRHTSGRVIEVLYNATVYKNEAGEVQGVFAAARDITERKRGEEVLRESEKRLRLLSSQLLVAQERERKLIAGEIHDSMGASLAATKFKMESALNEMVAGNPRARAALESVIPIIQGTMEEARRIQQTLRPSILDDLGILPAINWFCRQFETTYSNIRIEKEINIQGDEVPESLKIVIYRVLQEALNNVAKHSKASVVLLSLQKANQTIQLVVRDSGQGFDPEEAFSRKGTAKGLGLDSMRERAELSGGFFSIESSKGSGTVIRATWPLNS
jgi:PAS domain S-box-containing protein